MARDLLDQALEQQDQQRNRMLIQENVQSEGALDYNRAARIFEVQSKTRLPTEVIEADLDNLFEQVKRDEFSADEYTSKATGSPIFNEFAARDPYHPAIVERDRKNLTLLERQANSIGLGIKRGDAMLELSRISNRRRAGDKRPGDEEILEDLRKMVGREGFGLDSTWARVLVETGVQGMVQAYILGESWDEALLGAGYGGVIAAGGGVTVPLGLAVGAGVGWRAGAFDASRKLEQGLAFDEYAQAGLSEEQARTVSGLVGVANGALELVGLNAIVKYIPGARRIQGSLGKSMVDKLFNKPTVRGAFTRAAARYGEVMATEITTEILQESITIVGGEVLKRRARDAGDIRPETQAMTWDDFTDAVGQITVQTMMGTAIIGGIGPGGSFIGDVSRARKAQGVGVFVKSLGEAASDSETRKNVPAKFREYLQAQQEKGPVKELRFDSTAWRSYWESQGIDVDEVNQSLGLQPMETFDTAGDDIVLSLETFGDKIAHTEHFQELWKDVRLRPDDMTYREAQKFFANPEEHVNRLKRDLAETFGAEVSDDFDTIVNDVTGQLVALNYDRTAAEQQARLMATVFTTQALRNPQANVTPLQLYRERLRGIRRDVRELETQPTGAVDLTIDPLLDRLRANNFPTDREMYGTSLLSFVVKRGGLVDQGGELAARDLARVRVGLVNNSGLSLEEMAERAHDEGFIPERDPDVLLDMLDREVSGDPVFSTRFDGNEALGLNADLQALQEYLASEGIDLDAMTNQQVREALESRQTFEQTDDRTLKDLTDLIVTVLGNDLRATDTQTELQTLVGQLPLISEEQNLGDLEFVDRVRKDGREGTRTRKAQQVFDQEVKKRNTLKLLMDCMGG